MSKFTKGPWGIKAEEDGAYTQFYIEPNVATIFRQTAEGAANARLIAAAPEMYEALRPVAEHGEISAEIINRARAILAKVDA